MIIRPNFLAFSHRLPPSLKGSLSLQHGFTLIETLATLTIFAIVMALLSSSLFQVARLAQLSETQTTHSRDDVIRLSWLKNTLIAGRADWRDGSHLFQGSARHVSGLTTRPLSALLTGRTAFEWRLRYDPTTAMTELRYREAPISAPAWIASDSNDTLVHAWAGNRGKFTFLQDSGEFSDVWPSSFNAKPKANAPQLPAGVMLEFGEAAQIAFAAVADRTDAVLRPKDY